MQNKLLKGLGSVGELVEEMRECHFESIEADVSCRSIQAHAISQLLGQPTTSLYTLTGSQWVPMDLNVALYEYIHGRHLDTPQIYWFSSKI